METSQQETSLGLPPMSLDKAREILISHSKKPRNHRRLENCRSATAKNPSCGDEVMVQIITDSTVITDAAIQVRACTICTASASLLSEIITKQNLTKVLQISTQFKDQLTNPNLIKTPWPTELAALQSLEHLKINKTRVSCALLPWIALEKCQA